MSLNNVFNIIRINYTFISPDNAQRCKPYVHKQPCNLTKYSIIMVPCKALTSESDNYSQIFVSYHTIYHLWLYNTIFECLTIVTRPAKYNKKTTKVSILTSEETP